MFRKLILLLIFSFTYSALAASPSTYNQLKFHLLNLSKKELITLMNNFIHASAPSRFVGTPGHEKAVVFINEKIRELDAKATGKVVVTEAPADPGVIKEFYRKNFQLRVHGKMTKPPAAFPSYLEDLLKRKKSFPVQNIIWEKKGLNSDKVLVITAPYDTSSLDKKTFKVKETEAMPGANSNASGVAISLSLIRALAGIDLNYSVQIVFLDWQGIGSHGSHLYARELKKQGKDVLGVLNLQMLGQDTTYFDSTKKTGNMSFYLEDKQGEKKWAPHLLEHGSKITKKVNFEVKAKNTPVLESLAFSKLGFYSGSFSQNWEEDFNEKFYQTSQDTPETLNHETLHNSYQYIGGVVMGTLLDLTR